VRRRGIRVFALIAVIVALAIATLSLGEIHIGSLDRASPGPLGLRLGLDLQGGSHLVYQADLPDEVRVTFQDDVEESQLLASLGDLEQDRATVAASGYTIRDLSFARSAQEELRGRLEAGVAPIEVFEPGDGVVNVTFKETLDEADLRHVLDELGYTVATIRSSGDKQYILEQLPLVERAQERLRGTLEDRLAPVDAFELEGDVLNVTFQDALDEIEIRGFLTESGHTRATIHIPAQKRYTIRTLSLDAEVQQDFRRSLEERLSPITSFVPRIEEPSVEQMDGVVDTIQRRVNALGTTEPIIQTLGRNRVVVQLPGVGGSSVDVAFRGTPGLLELRSVLTALGRTGDTVEASSLDSYIVRTGAALATADRDALREVLDQTLGPLAAFEVRGDRELGVTFRTTPNESALSSILADLGYTEYTVRQQRSGVNSFIIRTDEALTTKEIDKLREALEVRFTRVVTFEVAGGIEEAKRLIGGTAQMVFKERECLVSLDELLANPLLCELVERGGLGRYVDKDLSLTGADLSRAFPGRDPTTNLPLVNIEFNRRGTEIFRTLTTRIAGDERFRIAIFLDEEQITAPVVRSPIVSGRGVIEGGFTNESARTLAIQLESGRLPVPLELVRESTVDALLGADSLNKSLNAGLVGIGLVFLFMVAYYRMAGVVAGVALIIYAIVSLAIFKMIPVTLTLSGIAGLVLSIGMAVDGNVIIFERMKEELRTGRTLASSMEVGFRRAWSAIRDGNVTVMLSSAILWWFGDRLGAPVVTGFAVTLLIGTLVSMFTQITVSRNFLQILTLTPVGKRADLFTPEPRKQPMRVAGGGK